MFMIFNKEYRKYESIMSELMGKMKKSANVERLDEENAEVYKLDTVDIAFTVTEPKKIVVKDKNGAEIVSLDCQYDVHDELQLAKWDLFCDFLKNVREAYKKRIEKANKLKEATEKAKKAAEAKQKVISAQAAKEKMLNDALNKLRGM